MSDDVLQRLEAQLLEAAARRPQRQAARMRSGLAVAAALVMVLVLAGGLVALMAGDTPRPATEAGRTSGERTTTSARTPMSPVLPNAPVPQLNGLVSPPPNQLPSNGAPGVPSKPARFAQQQLELCPTDQAPRRATGVAQVADATLALQAEGLPPSNRYLVWFYNGPRDAVPIGFAEYDRQAKRLKGGVQGLPVEAQKYRSIIITRESTAQVSRPRRIVLRSTSIEPAAGRQGCTG